MSMIFSWRARLAILAPLALAACAGAPTRIHTLDAAAPASPQPGGAIGPVFRVDAVHIPPAFDRPELIRRTAPYTLTLSDTDRWAAPIGELIRRTLTQDLELRLAPGTVIYPDAPKPAGASGLIVDILSISPTERGVEMDVSWTWLAPRNAGAAPAEATKVAVPQVAHLSTPAAGSGAAAIAPEISALVGKLADQIAASGSAPRA